MSAKIHTTVEISQAREGEVYKEYQAAEKIINEEYKIWKKTVPLLYDTIQTKAYDYPSLSIQWLPSISLTEDKNSVIAKFLYGTHTSGTSQDYLKLGSVRLPATLSSQISNSIPIPVNDPTVEDSFFGDIKKWKHNGEVNKIKISPNGSKTATMGNTGSVYLYDLESNAETAPIELKYHTAEGYGLEWLSEGQLLSGSGDNKIVLWDLMKNVPDKVISTHSAVVNDLSHNKQTPFLFGSCSDDFTYQIHDLRSSSLETTPIIKASPSDNVINSFKFHPDLEHLYITGGSDNLISLWDIRNPTQSFRKLHGHLGAIVNLEFNPSEPTKFSSVGLDRRILTWDLSLIGEDFNEGQYYKSDGRNDYNDPMLTFIHAGHTNKINEFNYHPELNNVIISSGDDNLIEVWKQYTKVEEDDEEGDAEESN